MSKITPNIKTLFKTLSTVLDEWGCANDSEHEAAQAARKLKQALILQYPPKAWKTDGIEESLPADVSLNALYKEIDSRGDKLQEVAKISSKLEKVIPLLLRAMETTDDLDLLEASVDLLEVHLARLSELTK